MLCDPPMGRGEVTRKITKDHRGGGGGSHESPKDHRGSQSKGKRWLSKNSTKLKVLKKEIINPRISPTCKRFLPFWHLPHLVTISGH